ncbi:MAG: winged helix-turn-helix transcriptional regulator [Candidatus Helarchaeota archaeon]|nr:winged helix-turn-helix transcriptional regulator [Candidatus Helarchaeota archaeon]
MKYFITESPVIITYDLTEKGKDLSAILGAMAEWSKKWNMVSKSPGS